MTWPARLCMAGVSLLFLGVCWLSFDQIEEDAFIFYRVAENLAGGAGFTFNRGDPPIECSSSLSYQLLLVPIALLGFDPIVPSKLLGIGLGVGALWLTYALGRRLALDPLFACLPPLLLAVSIPFYAWAQRGLETPLYGCALLATACGLLHPRLARRWLWLVAPALVALVARRRASPAAALVAGLLALTTLWAVLGEDWKPYNRHFVPALPFLALIGVWALAPPPARPRLRAPLAAYLVAVALYVLVGARAVYDFEKTWPNPLVHRAEPAASPRERSPSDDRIGANWQAAVGAFLRLNYPERITVVYDQMGQTPWYAGPDKVFVDSLGLTNREVGVSLFAARRRDGALGLYRRVSEAILGSLWPGERRSLGLAGILDFVFAKDAQLMLFHEELLALPNSVPSQLFRDPRLRERYRPRFRLEGRVRVFERKGFGAPSAWRTPEHAEVEELSR